MTKRQREVYRLIREAVEDTGQSPTQRELCKQLGIKSFVALGKHLAALERDGWIQRVSGQARGIRILRQLIQETQLQLFDDPVQLTLFGQVEAGQPVEAVECLDVVEFSDLFQAGNMVWQVRDDASEREGMQRGDYLVWRPGKRVGVVRML